MDEKLLDFINVYSVSQVQVIPKHQQLTFISNQNGIPEAWMLNNEGVSIPFGKYQDRVLGIHHSPLGDSTIIGMDREGNERQQYYLHTKESKDVSTLVESPNHFHNFGGWSPNGAVYCFSSNRRAPGFFDIFTQNIKTKEIQKVFEYDGICNPVCWLDEENIVLNINKSNIENSMYILNLKTKNTALIGNENIKASYKQPKIDSNNKLCYIITNENQDTLFLGRFHLNHPSKIEKIVDIEKWDVENIELSPNFEKISLTVNEAGYSKLGIYDVNSQKFQYVDDRNIGVIDSLNWMGNDQLVFRLQTPKIPGDIWMYHLKTEEFERLTFISEIPSIENNLVNPELYTFKSFDDLVVPYFLYSQKEDVEKPAVIYVHGGPESQIRPTYNPVIQYLQYKGFVVATPNVRGSSGYGMNYIKLDDGRKRMDSVKDLVSLVDHLKAYHNVNNKIGIIGRSYGGFMVLAALTHFPSVWSAGVDIVGISHFKTFLQNTGEWRRKLRESEYGSLEHDTDFFEEIAPLNHSEKIQAPLLVFHGENDTRVPVSEAKQLVKDMRDRKQNVKLTIFPDEGHQTEKQENVLKMHSESVQFFETHLKS